MRMLAGLLSVLMASPSFAGSGIFLAPQGAVQVKAADGSTMILAHRAEIAPGTEIQTGDASAALVSLTDGTKILLSPSSTFRVGTSNTNETTFDLAAGKLKAYFAGVFSGRLKIKTPMAVCAVRGTEFEISAQPEKTDVTVAEGHLEVSDKAGHNAVVTSEETVAIGSHGMIEPPHMVSLASPMAQAAARPFAVSLEMAKSSTRQMIEDLRNRELKANEAMLGKSVIDAFGNRVRLEEYLLRPAANQFQVLFLNQSRKAFNWGDITETFHGTLPNDPAQISAVVANTFLSASQPTNWLTNYKFFATNETDSINESVALGDPIKINFAGYGAGQLWYPGSLDWTQTLAGPGVPNGSRVQFEQKQDFGTTTAGLFTWKQSIIDNSGTNVPAQLDQFQLDPTSVADVHAGGCSLGGETCFDHSPAALNAFSNTSPFYQPTANFASFTTATSQPSGPGKADFLATTTYGDGSTLTAEKFLVSNSGEVLDFNNATASSFNTPGNYNLEDVVTSSLFQGRQINVIIAPEILAQKQTAVNTPSTINP